MSAYRKLTETLRDAVETRLAQSTDVLGLGSSAESWSRALALLEDELRAMGDND